MVKVLRNLKIDEVSAVDKAANQHARVALWKRDPAANFRRIFGAETLRDVLDRAAANPSLPRFAKQSDDEDEDRLREEAAEEVAEGEGGDADLEEELDEEEDDRQDEEARKHLVSTLADLIVEGGEGAFTRPQGLASLAAQSPRRGARPPSPSPKATHGKEGNSNHVTKRRDNEHS